jgi:hypothetical protein
MNTLHPNLPPLPVRMRNLPVDARGFPVPWFVQWFHPDGSPCEKPPDLAVDHPDFRVMDSRKRAIAIKQQRCWVCGALLGRYMAFVIGPMCAINRISSEPPSHLDCATFSARGCPFLVKPAVVRRENDRSELAVPPDGIGLTRNPGVALVWVTRSYRIVPARKATGEAGGYLVKVGDPEQVFWYCEGRAATRAEVMASIEGGLPSLMAAAALDGPEGIAAARTCLAGVAPLLPQEAA